MAMHLINKLRDKIISFGKKNMRLVGGFATTAGVESTPRYKNRCV
jgi:hypothetical protein